MTKAGLDTDEILTGLMSADITDACDVLRSVWEWSEGADGFVSVEVSPRVAHETDATVAAAREWHKRIDRPNLLVKVPATGRGVEAIRRLTAEGISINVTLIFSLARYGRGDRGISKRPRRYGQAGGKLKTINSVASFFVSRVDTEVDKRLAEIEAPEAHLGASGDRQRPYRL